MLSHSTLVAPEAIVGQHTHFEPGVIIKGSVEIGSNCLIRAYSIIEGPAVIGNYNKIGPYAIIGTEPQDRQYDENKTSSQKPSGVLIGSHNVIREFVTINKAAMPGKNTKIGNHCLVMANAHIGHDSQISDGVTLTYNVGISGHTVIGSHATMSGYAGTHQHTQIGQLSMIGGGCMITQDILPFCLVADHPARLIGPNNVGLMRAQIPSDDQAKIKQALKILIPLNDHSISMDDRIYEARKLNNDMVNDMIKFILESTRGILQKRKNNNN